MTIDAPNEERSGLRADARRNRERVLRAAVRHFKLHGIGASLEEIAKEAGVGAGTLYRHFPSREALVSAALRDRQAELLAISRQVRTVSDPDAALRKWLEALQDYLRTFDGLPAPVLASIKEQASPLSLSCDALVAITGEFLRRAQKHGSARPSVKAEDLFLCTLGTAWLLNRASTCGTSPQALNDIFTHGYLDSGTRDRPEVTDPATPDAPPLQ